MRYGWGLGGNMGSFFFFCVCVLGVGWGGGEGVDGTSSTPEGLIFWYKFKMLEVLIFRNGGSSNLC